MISVSKPLYWLKPSKSTESEYKMVIFAIFAA